MSYDGRMPLPAPFKLERYFARYEFTVRHLLSASDCEGLRLAELLGLADAESRALWDRLGLGYTESQGHPRLRAEIASLYQAVRADDVLLAAPEEAIFLAMHTLLEPGDHVVALAPAYQSLAEVARAIGCEVTAWPIALRESGWRLDLDRLAASLTPRTRLLVINFPNNPTGLLPGRGDLDAILELARRRGVYVFSDEMYRWLEPDPARRLPAVADLYELGITLSGLSKSFALAGLRLGWLATRAPGVIERCLALKDYTTICHSAPSEVLALMALRARDQILARNLDLIRANTEKAAGFFAARPDLFRWLPPDAGSVAFPLWTGPGTVEALCEGLIEQQGVMVVPGSLFDQPGRHFRVGLGRRGFAAALERIGEYLDS